MPSKTLVQVHSCFLLFYLILLHQCLFSPLFSVNNFLTKHSLISSVLSYLSSFPPLPSAASFLSSTLYPHYHFLFSFSNSLLTIFFFHFWHLLCTTLNYIFYYCLFCTELYFYFVFLFFTHIFCFVNQEQQQQITSDQQACHVT